MARTNVDQLLLLRFKMGPYIQTYRISVSQLTSLQSTNVSPSLPQWLFYSSLAAAVACDSLIAVSLCVLLVRSRTGYKRSVLVFFIHCCCHSFLRSRTDSLLTVLMLYSINTTLITRYVPRMTDYLRI